MARIRSIKPEFWTSAQVLECSTNARLLFVGLWNFCDDAGRHPWSAKQVKAEIFPADDFTETQISELLQELSKNGLITAYESENKQYFYVPGWKHQRIDKPQPPKYPDPFAEHSKIVQGTLPPDTIRYDTIGEDTKRSIAPAARKKATRLSEDWSPDLEGYRFAVEALGSREAAQKEFEKFRDYWKSKPGAGAVKLDWLATWRNWIRNAETKVKPHGNARKSLGDIADELANEARELEHAAGIGRPAATVGGD